MPSFKLRSEVNRLKAYVVRLKRSLKLRDERVKRLTAEGLGLQELLTVVGEQRDEARADGSSKRLARLRAHIRRRLREGRRELWDYYVFREDYGRRHNGHYGPLAHLRELPLQIKMLEDILAYR